MASRIGKLVPVLLLICMMFGLVSCTKDPDPVTTQPEPPTSAPVQPDVPDKTEGDDNTYNNKLIDNNSGDEGEVVYKVTFYTVDTKSLKLTQSVSAVKGGASLEPIKVLELVADSLEDSSVSVSFDGAYYDPNGYCVIEFNDSIKEISSKNPSLETLILDACGQSILDNIDSPGVIVRIGDGPYVTDQYQFGKDDVYMDM
ncbi:MAG: hypothetical protein IJL07_04530 [Lachnospiraceae bacterium]|nr:hypothetical protein [Lachnospiraceae bacterium]